MGETRADRDLVAHVFGPHGWAPLPYVCYRKVRAQHEAEHFWGVPSPRPGEVFADDAPQPRTVWD